MSSALAIASVTAVLKDLLNNGVIDHDLSSNVGEVIVTALPPDQIDIAKGSAKSQLNLFLYQVSPNQGWRNMGLPSHNSRGDRTSNPPLALDLRYLLTAYGADELHAEILLGYGMQWLHETPVLRRDAIRTALGPPSPVSNTGGLPASLQALATSELAEQVEQIKITLESLNTEELSKLWTGFQAKFRPSAAYQISVVLIESKHSTRSALPVRARNVYVVPFRNPVIDQIKSQESDTGPIVFNQPILAGYNLVIAGRQLRGDDTRVNLGGIEVVPADQNVTDTQIVLPIPAEAQAGVQGVQVIHQVLMGSPLAPHAGVGSNLAAFVLRPRIQTVNATDVMGSGTELRSASIEVTVEPTVGVAQRVVLLLNERPPALPSPPEPGPPLLAYTFEAPSMGLLSPPGPTSVLTIPVANVEPGTYLVRIQVDGAESPLGTNPEGVYDSPQIVIA